MTNFAKSMVLSGLTATVVGMFALMSTTAAHAEPQGSTCSDCPFFKGEYSIENHTGITMAYQFRWGDNQPWRTVVLDNDQRKTHTYPLGADPRVAIPTPSVRFDSRRCGGSTCNGATVWGGYSMDFSAVMMDPGFIGPGTTVNRGRPIRYMFSLTGGDFGQFNVDIVRK